MTKASLVPTAQAAKAIPAQATAAPVAKSVRNTQTRLAAMQSSFGNQGMLKLAAGGVLQCKLTINRPGDTFEHEADRIAGTVMRMPKPAGGGGEKEAIRALDASIRVQRMCQECEEELKPRTPGIGDGAVQRAPNNRRALQAKLTVNQPGDIFEQEADRVAETVMRMPETHATEKEEPGVHVFPSDSGVQRACKECEEERKDGAPAVQRMCTHCTEEVEHPPALQAKQAPDAVPEVTPDLASRIQSLQTGGQALPPSVRDFFEPRFGHDFSDVRVHADVDSTRNLQARAYTVGQRIVFGAGEYAPDTAEGKRLLAHELTHVIQQGAASRRAVQRRSVPTTSRASEMVQRAGDPRAIPKGFACPTDLAPSHPVGTDVLFASDKSTITADHTKALTAFVTTWLAAGGTDDILVHGYASTDGGQAHNWTRMLQIVSKLQTSDAPGASGDAPGASGRIQRQPTKPGSGGSGQGSGLSPSPAPLQTVTMPAHVNASSTPPEMNVDRIPPRVDTWVDVTLGGTADPAVPVTFSIQGQGSGNGAAMVDGKLTRDVSTTGKLTLKLQGVDQTDDSKHAGRLQLAAHQSGTLLASSSGFSISSIPEDMEFEFKELVKGHFRGIRVLYNWQSDSHDKSDLDKAPKSERIQHKASGSLSGAEHVTGCYGSSTKRDLDEHAVGPIDSIDKPGRDHVLQTFMFRDDRTGVENIPMKKSGFVVEHVIQQKDKSKNLEVVTSKKSADTTAKDPNPKCKSGPIASKAGGGSVDPKVQDI